MKIKILSLILAVLFTLTAIPSFAFGSENTDDFSANLDFIEAVSGKDMPASYGHMFVTRAEFIAYIIDLMGVQPVSGNSDFSDVATNHKYYDYICTAEDYGLIRGNGDGVFNPDNIITASECATMCVRALGYTDIIGFGMTTIQAISYTNLYDGIDSTLMNKSDAFRMLKNMCDEYVFEQTVFSEESREYKNGTHTFLEYFRNIKKTEGIITANSTASLTTNDTASQNCIMLDNVSYNCRNYPDSEDFLGYLTEVYYIDNSKREVVYSAPVFGANRVETINANDIISISSNVILYEKDGEEEKAQISLNADVMYNNMPCIPYSDSDFDISSGCIKLIDNGADSAYDCVMIEEFETYVVNGVSSSGQISCKFTEEIIEFDDNNSDMKAVDSNGNPFEIESLCEWDVLCVYASKDKSRIKIIKCLDEIEGRIDEISNNEKYTNVVINSKSYALSDAFSSFGQPARIGVESVFYLDISGNIVAYNENFDSSGLKFGYLVGIRQNKPFGENVVVKLLDENSNIIELTSSKTLTIDGEKYTGSDEIYSALGGINFKSVPVRYRANENSVSILDTPEEVKGGEYDSFYLIYSGYDYDEAGIASARQRMTYKGVPMIFDAKISLSSACKVAVVPFDTGSIGDDEDYLMHNLGYIVDDTSYCIAAYKTKKDAHDAEMIVIHNDDAAKSTLTDHAVAISVLDEISTILTADGEVAYKLSYYYMGGYYTYHTADAEVIESISINNEPYIPSKGDIIRLERNSQGNISICKLVYSHSKDALLINNPSSTSIDAVPRFQLAYVYEKYGSNIWTTRDKLVKDGEYNYTIDDLESKNASKYHIVLFDTQEDEVSIGNVNDIVGFTNTNGEECSKVFIGERYANPNTIVVYK